MPSQNAHKNHYPDKLSRDAAQAYCEKIRGSSRNDEIIKRAMKHLQEVGSIKGRREKNIRWRKYAYHFDQIIRLLDSYNALSIDTGRQHLRMLDKAFDPEDLTQQHERSKIIASYVNGLARRETGDTVYKRLACFLIWAYNYQRALTLALIKEFELDFSISFPFFQNSENASGSKDQSKDNIGLASSRDSSLVGTRFETEYRTHTIDRELINLNVISEEIDNENRVRFTAFLGSMYSFDIDGKTYGYCLSMHELLIELETMSGPLIDQTFGTNKPADIDDISLSYKTHQVSQDDKIVTHAWGLYNIPIEECRSEDNYLFSCSEGSNFSGILRVFGKAKDLRVNSNVKDSLPDSDEDLKEIQSRLIDRFIEKSQQRMAYSDGRYIAPLTITEMT